MPWDVILANTCPNSNLEFGTREDKGMSFYPKYVKKQILNSERGKTRGCHGIQNISKFKPWIRNEGRQVDVILSETCPKFQSLIVISIYIYTYIIIYTSDVFFWAPPANRPPAVISFGQPMEWGHNTSGCLGSGSGVNIIKSFCLFRFSKNVDFRVRDLSNQTRNVRGSHPEQVSREMDAGKSIWRQIWFFWFLDLYWGSISLIKTHILICGICLPLLVMHHQWCPAYTTYE